MTLAFWGCRLWSHRPEDGVGPPGVHRLRRAGHPPHAALPGQHRGRAGRHLPLHLLQDLLLRLLQGAAAKGQGAGAERRPARPAAGERREVEQRSVPAAPLTD